MLRSVGIPARLVVGFKGGEWNHLGHFYQVRQLHAHAWVEAYLPPDALPDDQFTAQEMWQRGGWLLLDPTPGGGRPLANASMGFDFMLLRQAMDYMRFLWSGFVVGMDASRQFELLYRPLGERLSELIRGLLDPAAWREWFVLWIEELRHGRVDWTDTLWRLGWLTLLAGGVIWGLRRWLVKRGSWAWLQRVVATWRGDETTTSVEFYRQLESILARQGFKRPPEQTQREFALQVGGWLADRMATRRVALVPLQVVENFYRVRFGGRDLDKAEAEAVEQSLFELQAALTARPH